VLPRLPQTRDVLAPLNNVEYSFDWTREADIFGAEAERVGCETLLRVRIVRRATTSASTAWSPDAGSTARSKTSRAHIHTDLLGTGARLQARVVLGGDFRGDRSGASSGHEPDLPSYQHVARQQPPRGVTKRAARQPADAPHVARQQPHVARQHPAGGDVSLVLPLRSSVSPSSLLLHVWHQRLNVIPIRVRDVPREPDDF